jgi:hypothetical protein
MIRPPIVGAEVWRLVMSAAGYRCQCEGACGRTHAPADQRLPGMQHRCQRQRGEQVPGQGVPIFVVAPARPAVSAMVAAALPVEELRAWCPACYSGAVTVARRAAKAAPEPTGDLFDPAPFLQPKRPRRWSA